MTHSAANTNQRTADKLDAVKVDAESLLDVVRKLEHEVSQQTVVPRVTLDSKLDRDLGMDSLARVELIARLEKHFQVVLPERIFAEAETPRDLLRAISAASGDMPVSAKHKVIEEPDRLSRARLEEFPASAETLVDVLHWHVQKHPQRLHIEFYDDDGEGTKITYGELWQGAQTVANGLLRLGVQSGDAVALMLLTGRDYFFSFFGVLMAGAIPVPIYPPARPSQIEDHLKRHQSILDNCQAVTLITFSEVKTIARLLQAQVDSLNHVVTVAQLLESSAQSAVPMRVNANAIAFLQYTSGSTGTPKGVILTHANLLANIRAMGERVEANSEDVFVSWLPLYHDMGLIGAWLGSLYYAALFVVMSPLAFLSRPQRWLWAIHRYRGTLSAAPNFGYELCLKRISDADVEGLDLSSWRAAFNGAEAVSPLTMENFCRRFQAHGFDAKAMMPVYGLAENSVGLAFPPLNRGARIDSIQRHTFMTAHRAIVAATDDKNALKFVSSGLPLAKHQLRVVDEQGRELPERREGRLQFCGPSATSGYFRNSEKTQLLFDGEWLDSGDLAYIAEGEVYITGRVKDIIIRAGRNLYPDEIEHAVGEIAGIRNGRVAVFASTDPQAGTERLVVMAESRQRDAETLTRLRKEVNTQVSRLIGGPPENIVLAPPGTVLKTSSGKIRRSACKTLFEKNLIGAETVSPWLQLTRMSLLGFVPGLRRIGRTAASTFYSLYCWMVFAILAPLTWTLVVVTPPADWRWKIMRASTRLLCAACGNSFTVSGRNQRLPREQPCIYVSNHASYLDGPLLITAVGRPFSFVAKAELDRSFIPSIFLRRIQSEFVERFEKQRGVEDAQRLAELTRQGRSLFYFPEGTFTRMPGLLPFHLGAFIAAVEAQVPVQPVILQGTRSILRADTWLPRRAAITVTIAEPIYPQPIYGDDGEIDTWASAVQLRNQVRQKILRHYKEPDLAHEKPLSG